MLDTCAAGQAAGKLVEKRDIASDQIRAIERLKDRTGFHVLMGSAADAVSFEATQYEQGLLTYALLHGMRGAALRENEFIDVSTLFQHAADEVPKLASNIGGIQRPRIAAPRGTSFDVGQLTAEDREAIPLASAKPHIVQPFLLNPDKRRDDLKLSARLREYLREQSYASVHGGVQNLPAVFVDSEELPGAIQPSGVYAVEGSTVSVNLVLVRDDEELAELEVDGSVADIPGLTAKMAEAIWRGVSVVTPEQ